MIKLNSKDKQAISLMIQNQEGECVARNEQRVQHWNVTYQGQRYRILYDSVAHQVRNFLSLGISQSAQS